MDSRERFHLRRLIAPAPLCAALVLGMVAAPAGAPPAQPAKVAQPAKAAQPAKPAEPAGEMWNPFPSDFPFQASCVTAPTPAGNTAHKGISIHLGEHAAMAFDTDLLRMSAAWTGAFLAPNGVAFDTRHGGHPQVAGDVKVATKRSPGWADGKGSFADPRKPEPYGPLPESWGRWDGLYTVEGKVVLAYTVLGTKVHEQPSAVVKDSRTAFLRTFKIDRTKQAMTLLLADVEGASAGAAKPADPSRVSFTVGGRTTVIAVSGAPAGARIETLEGGRVVLRLPKNAPPSLFKVTLWNGHHDDAMAAGDLFAGAPQMIDFKKGGKPHFPKAIVTKGELGKNTGPYTVDRLTTPFPGSYYRGTVADWKDNAYKRRIMIGGFDFFADGKRAAVSTWEGDVWIVSGIDDKLDKLTWRRFASGGYETLGLKIVNDVVYTSGRDQITRYHDLNGDGEADYYENFNNGVTSSTGFHEFQFDLHTDKQGNFYTSKAGPVRSGGGGFGGGGGNGDITRFAGTIQKISKDGKRREVYATGFRAPNGIGVGPDGQVTTGDNEGTWIPACPINWVKPGGFYGVETLAHKSPAPKFDQPLAWISKTYDNSGGSQVWVESDKWGPWKGELLHLSYGRASVYLVMKQKVGDLMQGGIVRMVGGSDATQLTGDAQKLTSSAMRARFNPKDGQLYVAGLAGWQTDAVSVTGFDRIRYTGKEVHTVRDLKVTSGGVHLTFSHPLDPQSVDPQNFSGERWNYRRTSAYGSPEYSVSNPEQRGHDRLDILATHLSPDGKTVTVEIDDLRPAHQMLLKFRLKGADGVAIKQSVMHTIHVVPHDPKARVTERVAKRGKPGLDVTFSAGGATDGFVGTNVALYVGAGKPPTPFLAPGKFQTTWEGFLSPDLRGNYAFSAELAGTLRVEVNGKPVLEATGTGGPSAVGKPVELAKGENRFKATFTSPDRGDAFVRLGWQEVKAGEKSVGAEPIAAALFRRPEGTVAAAHGEKMRQGRELFLEHRCARCHVADGKLRGNGAPELAMDGPSLDGIGSRRTMRAMAEWIADPRRVRSSARMPAVLHGPTAREDARAIAAFLATQTATQTERGAKVVETRAGSQAAEGEKLFETLQCQACHSPLMQQTSDDGKLSLMGAGSKFPAGQLAAFLRAPERHYGWTRMPNFRLTADEADALADYIHGVAGGPANDRAPTDAALVKRGKDLVESTGCVSCHQLGGVKNRLAVVDLTAGVKGRARSCLAEKETPADFKLTATQRDALKTFVGQGGLASLGRHDPAEFALRQTKTLQCTACHGQLEGFPALEVLGEKLRPEWSSAFIAGRVPYKPRPPKHPDGQEWLPARMPAFASRAQLLAEGMAATHGLPPRSPALPAPSPQLAKIGEKLVSADGGFACVTCHGVGNSPPTQVFETEGINLAYSGERLLPGYFARWMRNPLKIDPHTKMPVYFDEEGKSPLTTILDGDGGKQIQALWDFVRTVSASKGNRPVSLATPATH